MDSQQPQAVTSPERWMQVGISHVDDAAIAGAEACHQAWRGDGEALAIVFASDAYDLSALLRGVRSISGDVPLIGCSTAGGTAIGQSELAPVVVATLGGAGFSAAARLSRHVEGRQRRAGAEVSSCLSDVPLRGNTALMLLMDGLSSDQQDLVRGAYSVAGARVPMVGGGGADNMLMRTNSQFFGDEVVHGAVVGAAIASDAPFGVGVRHGWQPVGDPILVTDSLGCRVRELNDLPALDVYLDLLDAPAAARRDQAAFVQFALTHPLGISRRSGVHVRHMIHADFAERALLSVSDIPEGAVTWLMHGDYDSVLAATTDACADALAGLEGREPTGFLVFDCAVRRAVLGDAGVAAEHRELRRRLGGAPMAGCYTYGEIARTRGVTGFHNETLVVLAVG